MFVLLSQPGMPSNAKETERMSASPTGTQIQLDDGTCVERSASKLGNASGNAGEECSRDGGA